MVARPTEYEYAALFRDGKFDEAAAVAYKLRERHLAEAEIWLNKAACAKVKAALLPKEKTS